MYERYVEDIRAKLAPDADMTTREEWIRSKYEDKAFVTPSPHPSEDTSSNPHVVPVAKRFMDYFVVIGTGQVHEGRPTLLRLPSPIYNVFVL